MNFNLLYLLRRVYRRIRNWAKTKKNDLKLLLSLYFITRKKCYLMGTPTHTNIGDSAIVLAEISFLEKNGYARRKVVELTVNESLEHQKTVHKSIRAHRQLSVYWPGGGNFGDQWFSEEQFRRHALQALPDNPMLIFPQTIYYTQTERGEKEEQASIPYYNGRKGLTLVARERQSYEIMQRLYPDTEILLTPDIVLSATMETFGVASQERKGVLFCVRSDAEKEVSDAVWDELETQIQKLDITMRRIDMYSECSVTKENRAECVRKKMQEFAGAELVITDRLHGMVFAAITGTPCVVFSNYNHKVKGTYEWISYLPYVKYVENVEEAKECIPELLAMKDCHYDNGPLLPYFEKLAEVVREKCPGSV